MFIAVIVQLYISRYLIPYLLYVNGQTRVITRGSTCINSIKKSAASVVQLQKVILQGLQNLFHVSKLPDAAKYTWPHLRYKYQNIRTCIKYM